MVAAYPLVSILVALAVGVSLFPSLGGWAVLVALIAANVAGAGVALALAAAKRNRDAAATDRMVADLRSVLVSAQSRDAEVEPVRSAGRRVA